MGKRLDICRLIIANADNKNPAYASDTQFKSYSIGFLESGWHRRTSLYGKTPLHVAAHKGYVEICQLILDNVEEKNPLGIHNNTPLHYAASGGHYDVYKLIMDQVQNKNPARTKGFTPLH